MWEVLNIQSGPLKCNAEKVLYLLRCKSCDVIPCARKAKTRFRLWFNNYKGKQRSFRKEKQNIPQKRFHLLYIQNCHAGFNDWEVLEKCETHKQLKDRETFWLHKLKTFYPLDLNIKEEYSLQPHTVRKVLAFI